MLNTSHPIERRPLSRRSGVRIPELNRGCYSCRPALLRSNGLDAVLISARQRFTREPTLSTPVPGQDRQRACADLRLMRWEKPAPVPRH
jgi:hypothetical protein